ncbi:MAG: alpha/beta fold hydrolase [Parcubacteria group bacterium]|nr:alpha/beta fold hydrolase [Parcubacteria group bacterium]
MDYEKIILKPSDGINIKGWFIPGNSNKIVIMTHVGGLTKYGSTIKYKNIFKLYNKEIEFLKTAKHLHNKGYNILMFDFRNHGESDKSPNNGIAGVGIEEYKDVVAALDFIKSRSDLNQMDIGFVSFCMGANSTIIAMSKEPEKFAKVKCLMAIQPISMSIFVRTYTRKVLSYPIASLLMPMIKIFVKIQSGWNLSELSPKDYVKDIKVPTLYAQAKNDPWTELSDIQGFYKDTQAEKEFFWLKDTTHRFESYSYFENRPKKMLEWLERWM